MRSDLYNHMSNVLCGRDLYNAMSDVLCGPDLSIML